MCTPFRAIAFLIPSGLMIAVKKLARGCVPSCLDSGRILLLHLQLYVLPVGSQRLLLLIQPQLCNTVQLYSILYNRVGQILHILRIKNCGIVR